MATPVWTLDARDNILWDVVARTFALSPRQMHNEISGAHELTVAMLAAKGVDYSKLRNALTPQRDKHELALLFDSNATGNEYWYGLPVYERILAAVPRKEFTCALLTGDLLIENQDYGFELLQQHVVLHREVREFRFTNEIFGVYINNLSWSRAAALRAELEPWQGYIGYIDCTFASRAKDWMSTTLGTRYIKTDSVFIGAHEDDAEDGDWNLPGWPLEDAKYRLRSIPSTYFGVFLSYKIERRVVRGETDTRHSLNALTGEPNDLETFDIIIDEAKHDYVTKHKGGLAAGGLAGLSRQALEQQIRDRLSMSYIYALETKEHSAGVTNKFNVMLEFANQNCEPFRLLASFEYQPSSKSLRLLTLF